MIFTKELIEELDLVWLDSDESPKYGKAKTKNGKRLLFWNHKYYDEQTHHLTVKEDAGTRTVFHGRIRNDNDLILILKLVH